MTSLSLGGKIALIRATPLKAAQRSHQMQRLKKGRRMGHSLQRRKTMALR